MLDTMREKPLNSGRSDQARRQSARMLILSMGHSSLIRWRGE